MSGGGYVVVASAEKVDDQLEFWCFVSVQKADGTVSAQVYHRDGEGRATEVMSKVHDVLCSCMHRVNQHLLLKR